MTWYMHTVDTAANCNKEETETDRMWRQIDPVLSSRIEGG